MKILITKDEHLQLGFRNKFRKSGWEKDVWSKHKFIIEFMKKNNIKYKLTTGDILDKQTGWTFKQFLENKKLLEMYQENGISIITTAGNHDMIEGKTDIEDSVFEELVKDKIIIYPLFDSKILFDENNLLALEVHVLPFMSILDEKDKKEFICQIKKLKIKNSNVPQALIIHQNVTPDVRKNITEFTYDEITKECCKKGINILICGHYHIGFPTTTMNDVLVINPWNLWRVVRDYNVKEELHTPEIVILDLKNMKFEHIVIPHKKYQEAFNLVEVDTYKKIKKQFSFIQNINLDINMEDNENDILYKLGEKLKEKGIDEETLKKIYKEINQKLDL
jgi:DNA repair exonuclease SbcCD nuclease subunit